MKYNELTKRLLAEGYTAKNYPDYVKIPSGQLSGGDALCNLYGGFEYKVIIRDEFTYQTPCGFCVKGKSTLDGLSFGGVYYSHENDNVLVSCPYKKKSCEQNYARNLYGTWCQCHKTEEPYDYEKSIEKSRDDARKREDEKWEQFKESRNGRVCQAQCRYDVETETWEQNYDPENCKSYCPNAYCRCSVLNKSFSKKKGNVFYDLKKTFTPQQKEQIRLFDKTEEVTITKGKRYFPNPMPIEICEALVKMENGRILQHWIMNNGSEFIWQPTLKVEVLNIRAEIRESRDLLQDLKDIQEGIEISHESDLVARKKEQKKERREKAKEQKRNRYLKKISSVGWMNLESNEKRLMLKVLSSEEVNKADLEFKKKTEQKEKQITLWGLE